LKDGLQHRGIAIATLVSKSLKVLVLYILLKPKLGDLRLGENAVFAVKVLAAAAAMGLTVWLIHRGMLHVLPPPPRGGTLFGAGLLACRIGLASLGGLAVFGGMVVALRVQETQALWRLVRRR
jgi:peptidoglycan biosynthesis protein MviN/MurJ (putative lipid II flippase)